MDETVTAVANARTTLLAGFTAARDLGSRGFGIVYEIHGELFVSTH